MDNAVPIVCQELPSCISPRYQERWFRPGDIENRVQRTEAGFGIGAVGGTVQINELGVVNQRLETMGETVRDEKARTVSVLQDLTMPPEERWRTSSNIHHDVKYATVQAGDNLRIGMW